MFCGILGAGGLIVSQCGEAWVEEQIRNRIGVDHKARVGKPAMRGTRKPVELIAPRRMLAQGIPEREIMREYPRRHPDDIRAALAHEVFHP